MRWARFFSGDGWEVATVSLEPGEGYPGEFNRLDVSSRLPDALRYPMAVGRVRAIAERFHPHVVNAHFVPNYGAIAAMLGRRPWVLSTWGSDVMTDPDKSAFHRWRTRRVLNAADWVTSDAEVMTRRIVGFGVPEGRILTFPYGVDTGHFHPPHSADRAGPRIVSIRKLEPVYSVETLVDAFAAVLDALPTAKLTLAGDGSLRRLIEERAANSAGAGHIDLPGAVRHEQVPSVLGGHHLYVSTARSDTTSVSLLEAMGVRAVPRCHRHPRQPRVDRRRHQWPALPTGRCRRPGPGAHRRVERRGPPRPGRERNLEIIRSRALWQDSMEGTAAAHAQACRRGGTGRPAAVQQR